MIVFQMFTFLVYSVQRICAQRPFALATDWGTLRTILTTNLLNLDCIATVRQRVASD